MIDHVLLHIEVAKDPRKLQGGWKNTAELGICLAVLYEWSKDRSIVFGPNDINQLRERLTMADWISGFNLLNFAYPIMWGKSWNEFRMGNFFRPMSARTNDLVQRILLGMGLIPDAIPDAAATWTLKAIGKGTIGRAPSGTGIEAGISAALGNWPAAVSYALDSVSVLTELIRFTEKYGYVIHGENNTVVNLRNMGPRSPLQDAAFLGPLKPTGNTLDKSVFEEKPGE